jgi:hypothetical protein
VQKYGTYFRVLLNKPGVLCISRDLKKMGVHPDFNHNPPKHYNKLVTDKPTKSNPTPEPYMKKIATVKGEYNLQCADAMQTAGTCLCLFFHAHKVAQNARCCCQVAN